MLINKMDLVDKEDPKRTRFEQRKAEIEAVDERIEVAGAGSGPGAKKGALTCYPTSIWDESLYKVRCSPRIQPVQC